MMISCTIIKRSYKGYLLYQLIIIQNELLLALIMLQTVSSTILLLGISRGIFSDCTTTTTTTTTHEGKVPLRACNPYKRLNTISAKLLCCLQQSRSIWSYKLLGQLQCWNMVILYIRLCHVLGMPAVRFRNMVCDESGNISSRVHHVQCRDVVKCYGRNSFHMHELQCRDMVFSWVIAMYEL